jgi:hypothetical protein
MWGSFFTHQIEAPNFRPAASIADRRLSVPPAADVASSLPIPDADTGQFRAMECLEFANRMKDQASAAA